MDKIKFTITSATAASLYSVTVMTKRFFPYANFTFEEINRRIATNNIFYYVAMADRHTVGFVDFELKGQSMQVLGLAVLEEFRGRGIGKALLVKALSEGKRISKERGVKLKRIDLMVLEENDAARKIYAQLGFRKHGVLDKQLWDKKVLVYTKELMPARVDNQDGSELRETDPAIA